MRYPSRVNPPGAGTCSGLLVRAPLRPAASTRNAPIAVDFPELFGPTRTFIRDSETEKFLNPFLVTKTNRRESLLRGTDGDRGLGVRPVIKSHSRQVSRWRVSEGLNSIPAGGQRDRDKAL